MIQPQAGEACASTDCGRDLYKISAKLTSVIEFERQLAALFHSLLYTEESRCCIYVFCVIFDTVIPTYFSTLVH
jgi:hypothetical protein